MDELEEREAAWELLLERAESLVAGDPFSARGWAHHVEGELERWRQDHPQTRDPLAMLAQRTQSLIELTERASQRMLDESAERGRRWHERELHDAASPTREVRRPFPG